ncbi:SCO family protein [Curvibacter sp. HBC61]|uniref:SCO family protein n=1 Tax=Curvibacter cyanobacteriorum TaxID=3026422 RepID=A0ABT5N0W6_9BURK|nr:SCO family protein [Curvibacter sp. HBC61]MDD0839683.1 SCO family protein [Curvibacter sp. HBC61]
MQKRPVLRFIASALLATTAAALMTACAPAKSDFKAVDITGAEYGRDFRLPDQNGQVRSLADFKGKAVVVFFGYTQCPDVCPTTMSELAEVKRQLGPDGDRLQGIFISIDPARDTPELLKAYMVNFDPSFIALRAESPEQLAALAKDFKIYYKKVEGKTPTSYTMDHSAGAYLYDPQGRLRLFARYGAGPQALLSDLKILLKSS